MFANPKQGGEKRKKEMNFGRWKLACAKIVCRVTLKEGNGGKGRRARQTVEKGKDDCSKRRRLDPPCQGEERECDRTISLSPLP